MAAAVPGVLFDTRFGQVLALQALAIAGALIAARRDPSILAAALAGTAVMLEAGHSHAFAMAHIPLLLSQMLHLLAAGAWLGGLLPLLIVVREVPLDAARLAARRFSTLGTISVSALAATALPQGTLLSGGLTGLAGTAYGAVLLLKAVLFAALISIAATNRFRLMPALAGRDGEKARKALAFSIGIENYRGSLRGICREPAQQPRAWNAYAVGDIEMAKGKIGVLAVLCMLLGGAMVEHSPLRHTKGPWRKCTKA
jgi:copper resistance protein D